MSTNQQRIFEVPAHLKNERDEFLEDVFRGFRQLQKSLPCKYFYDERGSRLFEQICDVEEYYLTRTEISIMRLHASEMAELIGKNCALIEYGNGSSRKTRILLNRLEEPAAYIPIDISREALLKSVRLLERLYPEIGIVPICADFTEDFALPDRLPAHTRKIAYFPGSTVGNFDDGESTRLLSEIGDLVGRGGGLLIGFDLEKDRNLLENAYNDGEGFTARFNLNLLRRINRELKGNFRLENFSHKAVYNEILSRIEMHLVSLQDQIITVSGQKFSMRKGETIFTESSYKYRLNKFRHIAEKAGFEIWKIWTDPKEMFAVAFLNFLKSR